jgi:glycosyltransferase involved in cell wall biosynthesis
MRPLLFVSAHLPSDRATQAGQRTSHWVLAWLAARWEVHLVAASGLDAEAREEQAAALRARCADVTVVPVSAATRLRGVAHAPALPLRVAARWSPVLWRAVAHGAQRLRPDVVLFDHVQMLQYAPVTGGAARRRVALVHDVLGQLTARDAARARDPVRRALLRAEARRLWRWERTVLGRCDQVLVQAAKDRDLLADVGVHAPIGVIPPYVDSEWTRRCVWREERKESAVLFWGAMDRAENVDAACLFAERVLPAARRGVPGLRFFVVGAAPGRAVRRLAWRDAGVEVTGFVPDPVPYFERCVASVAPLRRGAGIKVKVLESMLAGLPVVGSSIAAEGIAAGAADGLFVADGAEALGRSVAALARDPARARAAGAAARAFAEARYGWDAASAALARAFDG